MTACKSWIVIEGNIQGEVRSKPGKNGTIVTNIGFPVETTESPGMEHKDFWVHTVSFGGLGEKLASLPPGFNIHVEGDFAANRWLDSNGMEKSSLNVILRKAGEAVGLGQQVKYFDIPRKKKESKPGEAIKAPAAAAVEPVQVKLSPEVLDAARAYLQKHEQHTNGGDLGDLGHGANELPGPGPGGDDIPI